MSLCNKCRTCGRPPNPGRPGLCTRCGVPLADELPAGVRRDPPEDGLPNPPEGLSFTNLVNIGADYTDEEREFLQAVERYKRTRRRPYPTWREVLLIAKALGYRRPDVDEEGKVRDRQGVPSSVTVSTVQG